MPDRNTNDLHPDLQPIYKQWFDQCIAAGLNIRPIFTYRTPEEQDALYAQGRTKPGKRVTNLKGLASKHCFTLPDGTPAAKAFDFGIFEPNGDYVSYGDDHRYTQAGEIGESLGLVWGGRWVSPHDPDHLQLI